MTQMVRDASHPHEVHKKASEVLKLAGSSPTTFEGVKNLNDHLRRLNAFFDQLYVKDLAGDYMPPAIPIVEHTMFGTDWSYCSDRAKRYFDSTISRIHDVIENLPFVHVIAPQKDLPQPLGFRK